MNIYQKLQVARDKFLEAGVKKSGINTYAEFKYFELSDIVPVASEIFTELGCIFITTFTETMAVGRFINTDDPTQEIQIGFEVAKMSEPAKYRMNEIQAAGAGITYMRRYLYLILLDIIQNDELDTQAGKPISKTRSDIKDNLTNSEGKAEPLQIKSLKTALKRLKDLDATQERYIKEVLTKTNNLTNINKAAAEQLILKIGEMIKNYEE